MLIFLKSQAASMLGSLADFLVTVIVVEIFHCWYIAGNLAGNICGAVAQFILCRNWAFDADRSKTSAQILKFILVWVVNLLLSASGVYFFTHYLNINYIVSKAITSAMLGVSYNYFLQKKFVFV